MSTKCTFFFFRAIRGQVFFWVKHRTIEAVHKNQEFIKYQILRFIRCLYFKPLDMKNTGISIVYILIVFIFSKCSEDSPLSDIEITDPSLIAPHIMLSHHTDMPNKVYESVNVWLYDKNFNSIEIKNGKVKLTGKELSLEKSMFTSAPYYNGYGLESIETGKTFNFEIILSNGNIYKASVKAPIVFPGELNLPANHSRTMALPVSWQQSDESCKATIELLVSYGNPETNSGTEILTLNQSNLHDKSFVIPLSYFQTPEPATKIEVTLKFKTLGTMDEQFRTNSEISTIFSVKNLCYFID